MNIKELEFIRDFNDQLDTLYKDIGLLSIALDDENNEIDQEFFTNYSWSVSHQAEALAKLFLHFKENLDKKYWDVWVAKYP